MNRLIAVAASLGCLAGIVHEGMVARARDPFNLTYGSIVFVVVYAVLLFCFNFKRFHKIDANNSKFDFDAHNLLYSFFIPKDRSRRILTILQKDIQVSLPGVS